VNRRTGENRMHVFAEDVQDWRLRLEMSAEVLIQLTTDQRCSSLLRGATGRNLYIVNFLFHLL
jgi:hypothetical protein